jgi:Fe-S cluster biosynthesis and repair protein YggX
LQMYPTQIGRIVCQCISRSGWKWRNEMNVQLFFEGTATYLIIETPLIEFQHVHKHGDRQKYLAEAQQC